MATCASLNDALKNETKHLLNLSPKGSRTVASSQGTSAGVRGRDALPTAQHSLYIHNLQLQVPQSRRKPVRQDVTRVADQGPQGRPQCRGGPPGSDSSEHRFCAWQRPAESDTPSITAPVPRPCTDFLQVREEKTRFSRDRRGTRARRLTC